MYACIAFASHLTDMECNLSYLRHAAEQFTELSAGQQRARGVAHGVLVTCLDDAVGEVSGRHLDQRLQSLAVTCVQTMSSDVSSAIK